MVFNSDFIIYSLYTVAPIQSTGARAPHFYKLLGTGARHGESKSSKQETDETVLTITKVITKTTSSTFRNKKVKGHDQTKIFRRFRTGAPTFKFVPAPLYIHWFYRIAASNVATDDVIK